jgi:ferredoxin-type protein NapH
MEAARMEWKLRLKEAIKVRRIEQYIMGTIFMSLLIAGWYVPLIGYFIPVCMIAGVGMATVRGRQWCNWYCPRGSFADTYLKLISPDKKIPRLLKSNPFRIAVLVFLMAMLTFQIIRLWPDGFAIGGFFVILLTITTVIGIILSLIYHQRSWCYICPIGSLSSWAGKNKHQLTMNNEACISCNACSKTCPMQLTPVEMKEAKEMQHKGDCLKCELCVASCPKDALSF